MKLFSKYSYLCDHGTSMLQIDGQTEDLPEQYRAVYRIARQKW